MCRLVFLTLLFEPNIAYNSIPPRRTMRAWSCHGRTQAELVENLKSAGIITSSAVTKVMNLVDRRNYIVKNPYEDSPQSLGLGQTISAPHMHAHVLQTIIPSIPDTSSPINVLDVGSGSGYLTACLGRWLKSTGRLGSVYGVDILPELVEQARLNIAKEDIDLLEDKVLGLTVGNGWNGWEKDESIRMDAIHVGAAASSLPQRLATSLKVGGVMIIPIGPDGGIQHLHKIERISEQADDFHLYDPKDYSSTPLMGVRYVPLVQGPNLRP